MDAESCVSSAVLTGGVSRRMGVDKALIRVDGQTVLRRTIDVLRAVTSHVMIVGDRPAYHGLGVPVVADLHPQAGALGGIATALELSECAHVLVVACDMPFLSSAVLREMTILPRDYDVLVPVTIGCGRDGSTERMYHPLHAVYARGCLPEFRRAISSGKLRIADAFAALRVIELSERWMKSLDERLATLANVNTPQELDEALKVHRTR